MLTPPIQIQGYTVQIILPFNYEESKATYPVVYVQDGGDLVMDGYNELDHLTRTNQIQPCIYVGIEPINRNDDYTPWAARGLKEDSPWFGGKAKDYLQVLISSIKPYVDSHYRTKRDAKHTAIAGASLGALLSLFASYWSPNVFGHFILISPSAWYEGVLDYIKNKTTFIDRNEQQLYLYVGELEGIYHTTLQQFMVSNVKELALLLEKESFANSYFSINPVGTHDAHYFTSSFIEAMKKLFKP